MQRFLFILTMIFCVSPMLFSQADRNTRYVAVQTVTIKDSTGFFARDMGSLSLGDTVTVIRESCKWTEVRTGNLRGWVAAASLSARQVVTANLQITASEVALSGKGFSPDVEMEYRRNGLDFSMVDSMEQMVIPADELLGFITEGRLARGE